MGERIPISMSEAIDGWLADCALAGMSRATIKNYRSGTRCLTAAHVTDFTSTLARELMAAKIRRGLALSSCKTFYGYLCSLANWCVRNGYLAQSPMIEVPCPKPPERPHRYLTPDELRRLWDAACASRREPETNKLILLLLLEGLRAGELCSLRWRDVGEDRIVVAFGKGGKVRAIPLSEGVRSLLAGRKRSDGRILSLSVGSLEERLKRLGTAARVAHVHPHLLRHTAASLSLRAGMDTDSLLVLFGWSANSTMVQRYTASIREDAALDRAAGIDLAGKMFG